MALGAFLLAEVLHGLLGVLSRFYGFIIKHIGRMKVKTCSWMTTTRPVFVSSMTISCLSKVVSV